MAGPGQPAGRPLTTRALHSFLWAALSFGSSRLVVFIMTLLLARLLAPEDFGVVAAGLTIIAFLEIALDLGVGAAVVYEQEQGVSHRVRTASTLNLVLSSGVAAVGVLAAPAVASFFQAEDSVGLFRLLFLYLVLRGAGQIPAAVLQRDLRFKERTVVDVTRSCTRAATSIACAVSDAGAWSIVLGLIAGELAGLVIAYSYVRVVPTWRLQPAVMSALLRFGVAVLGIKVISAVLTSSDKIIIGNRLGPEELGLYVIAFRLPELAIDTVGWIFSSVAFPLYSQARAHGPEAFRSSMLKALRLTTLFGFSAGVGLAVVAPLAVPVLFSDSWAPAVGATVFLALATGVSSIGYASGDIFPAVGRPQTLLWLSASTVPFALLAFWLAWPYGITAVAAAHLVFQVVFCGLRLHVANRLVGVTWGQDLAAMGPSVLSALGVLALALPVSQIVPMSVLGLVATVLAGCVGAALALTLFARSAVGQVVSLVKRSRGRV